MVYYKQINNCLILAFKPIKANPVKAGDAKLRGLSPLDMTARLPKIKGFLFYELAPNPDSQGVINGGDISNKRTIF